MALDSSKMRVSIKYNSGFSNPLLYFITVVVRYLCPHKSFRLRLRSRNPNQPIQLPHLHRKHDRRHSHREHIRHREGPHQADDPEEVRQDQHTGNHEQYLA